MGRRKAGRLHNRWEALIHAYNASGKVKIDSPFCLTIGKDHCGMPAQTIIAPPSTAALFLVFTIDETTPETIDTVRDLFADFPGLNRTVSFRYPDADLYGVIGIAPDCGRSSPPHPSPSSCTNSGKSAALSIRHHPHPETSFCTCGQQVWICAGSLPVLLWIGSPM